MATTVGGALTGGSDDSKKSENKFQEPNDNAGDQSFDKFALNENLNKIEDQLMELEKNLENLKGKFKQKLDSVKNLANDKAKLVLTKIELATRKLLS